MVIAMTLARGVAFGGFVDFVARAWRRMVEGPRTQGVEDEVRFELLKGLVR
jgi:hypothetical protein